MGEISIFSSKIKIIFTLCNVTIYIFLHQKQRQMKGNKSHISSYISFSANCLLQNIIYKFLDQNVCLHFDLVVFLYEIKNKIQGHVLLIQSLFCISITSVVAEDWIAKMSRSLQVVLLVKYNEISLSK